MQDTVEFIRREMPVVMVVTDRFVNEALEVAKNSGISDPPILVIEHPFATLNSEELDNLVEKYFGAIVTILIGAQ